MTDETPPIANAAKAAAPKIVEEAKSFFERAQEALEDVVESTVEAVKEHPIAAAAIASGVVAGAAYGVSKLLDDEAEPTGDPAQPGSTS